MRARHFRIFDSGYRDTFSIYYSWHQLINAPAELAAPPHSVLVTASSKNIQDGRMSTNTHKHKHPLYATQLHGTVHTYVCAQNTTQH